jgi:hypothetical protein
MTHVSIPVTTDDPVYQVWQWRNDSARLFVLQPALDRAMGIFEQPCVLGERFSCLPQSCSPCLIFDIQNRMRRSIT